VKGDHGSYPNKTQTRFQSVNRLVGVTPEKQHYINNELIFTLKTGCAAFFSVCYSFC